MESKNLLYNFGAKSWSLFLLFLSVPLYLHYLGIEAYGLVGFYTTLSSLFSLLDIGLSATTSREVSQLSLLKEKKENLLNFCKTLESVYWIMGIGIGLTLILLSPWISSKWLHGQKIDSTTIQNSLFLMAASLSAFWPFTFYSGALNALEKQASLSLLTIFSSSLRIGMTLLVLSFFSTVEAFFLTQAACYLLQTLLARFLLRQILPLDLGKFGLKNLRKAWRFSAGVGGISLTTSLLSNIDKVILSKWVSLEEFGLYTLAAAISSSLVHMAAPFFTTFFPHFSKHALKTEQGTIRKSYFACCHLLTSIVFPAGALLFFFPMPLLSLWNINPAISVNLSPLLTLMVIGSICNCLLTPPFALQLSFGWTRLSLYQNLLAIPLFIPLTILAIFYKKAEGAALIGSLFQLACLFITIPLMHQRILIGEFKAWLKGVIAPPFLISTLFCLLALTIPREGFSLVQNFLFLGALFCSMIGSCYLHKKIILIRHLDGHTPS